MARRFFTRRPEPAREFVPDRASWPKIGETWQPEGVIIAERYYNLGTAVVLVYTNDDEMPDDTYYVVACLGCHYTSSKKKMYSSYTRYSLTDAAKAANDHASTCRALPRDVPARPDDTGAQEQLQGWILGTRGRSEGKEDVQVQVSDLDLVRLKLQRTTEWIENELAQLAAAWPDVLRIERSTYSPIPIYYVRSLEG